MGLRGGRREKGGLREGRERGGLREGRERGELREGRMGRREGG